jgi:hypothetical protein
MRQQGAVFAVLLLVVACTGEPISKRVGPGATVTVTLPETLPGLPIGYGSAIGGADRQRGALAFVLCVPSVPGCDPSPGLTPRQGYRMETTYVTRAQADRAAPRAGERLIGALLQVPSQGDHRPAPGTYLLEPRITPPGQPEVPLTAESTFRTLEITAEDSPASPQAELPDQILALMGGVPRPAVAITHQVQTGDLPAASAELLIDIPASKVSIAGVAGGSATAMVDVVPVDADTVRVMWIAKSGVTPAVGAPTIELYFDLLANASPALSSEFTIVDERAYDPDGALLPSSRFEIAQIF